MRTENSLDGHNGAPTARSASLQAGGRSVYELCYMADLTASSPLRMSVRGAQCSGWTCPGATMLVLQLLSCSSLFSLTRCYASIQPL